MKKTTAPYIVVVYILCYSKKVRDGTTAKFSFVNIVSCDL